MAKVKNVTETETETVAPAEATLITSVSYAGFEVATSSINIVGLSYLLQYGFAKSIQDAVAGRKKELSAETNEDGSAKHTEEEVAAIVKAEMADRVEKIVSGTIGVRTPGAPRATPFEAMVVRVAKEYLRAAAAAAKKVLPKADDVDEHGANKFEPILAAFTERNRERIEAEARLRVAAEAEAKARTEGLDLSF